MFTNLGRGFLPVLLQVAMVCMLNQTGLGTATKHDFTPRPIRVVPVNGSLSFNRSTWDAATSNATTPGGGDSYSNLAGDEICSGMPQLSLLNTSEFSYLWVKTAFLLFVISSFILLLLPKYVHSICIWFYIFDFTCVIFFRTSAYCMWYTNPLSKKQISFIFVLLTMKKIRFLTPVLFILLVAILFFDQSTVCVD